MRKKIAYSISLKLFTLLLITPLLCCAQKLPSTQTKNLRSLGNIKIDGKATEWNNVFQAYNRSTGLYYTLSNDDSALYLAIQARDPRIIEKIIAVGVTFTLNKKGAKNYKDDENVVVTFPLLSVQDGSQILTTSGIKTINSSFNMAKNSTGREGTYRIKQSDSLVIQANKLLKHYSNTIKINGMPGVPDTLSIYNKYNIKTAAAFDNLGAYTYELSLPLKQLGVFVKKFDKFSYSIKLNSRLEVNKKGIIMTYRYNSNDEQIDVNQDLDSTTDFWAEYSFK